MAAAPPSWLGNMSGTALITGAASGIGSCCARAFARLGAKLVLIDLNLAGLQKLEKELALPPGHVILKAIDVRDSKGLAEFIATIPSRMGGLHFCINCSGILGPNYDDDIANQPDENWSLVLDINLKAPAIITKEVVKIMLKQDPLPSQLEGSSGRAPGSCSRRGVIINMGSSASLRARSASGSPYILSKHGLVGLTKSTAVSYAKHGIRCNILAPGFVRTPLIAGIADKVNEVTKTLVPLGRPAEPEEVADQVIYLCSERASYLNGVIVPVDGGWSCT